MVNFALTSPNHPSFDDKNLQISVYILFLRPFGVQGFSPSNERKRYSTGNLVDIFTSLNFIT